MLSFKTIGSFIATGIVAQLAAAVAGLLLVRWMSVGDYAIYTVAITMIGALAMITRGGVQLGLAAALSHVWPDRALAAAAVGAANRTRLFVSALTLPGIVGMAWYLLVQAGADTWIVAVVIAILVAIWLADLRGSVVDQVLNFAGQAIRLQALDSAIAIGRVGLVAALWLANAVSVTFALLTNLFAVAARVPVIQRWLERELQGHPRDPAPEAEARLHAIALRQIPVDLFTALQGPVTLFLLTRSGASLELATYGALARIAQILTPFSAVSLAYFVPAFAKTRSNVGMTILGYVALGSIPGIALLVWAILAPGTLLFLIGPQYAGQAWALVVCAATIAAMSAVQIGWTLVAHRGWNRWGWVRIAFGAAWCLIGPALIPVDTAAGGYLFYCGFAAGTVIALVLELSSARKTGEIALGAPSP